MIGFPTGYIAIKHILREFKQICNEEASAGCAKGVVLLGLSNKSIYMKQKENAALACS